MRSKRLAGLLAIASSAASMGLAEAAQAQVPTQVRVGAEVTSTTDAVVARANCLAGEVALGGGHDTNAATASVIVHTSRPFPQHGTPTGWDVIVTGGTVTPYVVCVETALNPFSSVTVRTALGTGGPTPSITEASCLAGERATGGGFDTEFATADTIVHTSRPVPPSDGSSPVGWLIAVTGVNSTAYAVCAAGGADVELSVHSRAVADAGPTQTVAPCDPGDTATGGGFDTDQATSATIVNTSRPQPSFSGATPTGWSAYITGVTGTVYAICSNDAPPPPPPPVCDPSLPTVGCWHFDEQSGTTAFDSSGHNNHGTYVGNPILGVPGVFNTAVRLDGVDDHVRVPDSESLDVEDSFTLEGWILRDDENETHQMFNKGGKGFHLVVMDHYNGNQVWLRKAGVSTIVRTQGSGVPADGQFHHVVAVKDTFSVHIYIDGVEQPLQLVSKQTIENTAFPLFFSATASGNPIDGVIDEYAVYDRALTAAEVQQRYAQLAAAPVVVGTSTRTTSTSVRSAGGSSSGAGACADIGRADSGITGVRQAGMSCAEAKDLMVRGPKAMQAAGMDCAIVSEDFAGRVVRITRECTGSSGRELRYTTLS